MIVFAEAPKAELLCTVWGLHDEFMTRVCDRTVIGNTPIGNTPIEPSSPYGNTPINPDRETATNDWGLGHSRFK